MYLWHKTSKDKGAATRYRNDILDHIGNQVTLGIGRVFMTSDGILMMVYRDCRFTEPEGAAYYVLLGCGSEIPDDWVEQIPPDEYDTDWKGGPSWHSTFTMPDRPI